MAEWTGMLDRQWEAQGLEVLGPAQRETACRDGVVHSRELAFQV